MIAEAELKETPDMQFSQRDMLDGAVEGWDPVVERIPTAQGVRR